MSDGRKKLILLTGGNVGLGLEACKAMCEEGHSVVATVRSDEKGELMMREVKASCSDADIRYLICEVSDPDSVRQMVEKFKAECLTDDCMLDVLINNAGMSPKDGPERTMCDHHPDWEISMATNCFGPILLTDLLSDSLIATAAAKGSAMVVMVNSSIINMQGMMAPYNPDPNNLMMKGVKSSRGFDAYKNSKTALMWTTLALIDELQSHNVSINSMCPGAIPDTAFSRNFEGGSRMTLKMLMCCCFCCLKPQGVPRGASYIVDLALHNQAGGTTGKFWVRGKDTAVPDYCEVKENQQKVLAEVRMLTGFPKNGGK